MEGAEEVAAAANEDVVIPGDFLCQASKYVPGRGTNQRHNRVFSSLTGRVRIDTTHTPLPLISVRSKKSFDCIPDVGSVVIGKVINISERQAKINLLSVNGATLAVPLRAVLRKEDVRATEKDTVEIFHCFRPGDIVRARVISLGGSQAYTLSTAENELGVVMAFSDSGAGMIPVSWCEMQCSETGVREKRKVAKVVNAAHV